jgi:hypothetical protein
MSDGGKGSAPRPFSVTQKEYATRWDAIFGQDLKEERKEDLSVLNVYNDNRQIPKPDKVKERN